MSKTVKLLNEGFEQKYMEKEVFHNDNGTDYDVIERSKSGQNALLNNGNQWIIAWNCPEDNKGSWGQGHYFFDEDSARDAWERNYLSESFDTDDNTVEAVCKECGTKGYAHKHTADENGEFTCSSCKKLHEDSTFDKSKAQKKFKELRSLVDDERDTTPTKEGELKKYIQHNLYEQGYTVYAKLLSRFNVELTNDSKIDVRLLPDKNKIIINSGLKEEVIKYVLRELKKHFTNESINPKKLKESEEDNMVEAEIELEWNPDEVDFEDEKESIFEDLRAMIHKNFNAAGKIYDGNGVIYCEIYLPNSANWERKISAYINDFFSKNYPAYKVMGVYVNSLNESVNLKKLKECLKRLNEAEMSPEDKADSKILWDIYNKTQNRRNAKLTPEENAVLDKYGLVRNSDWQTISKSGGKYGYGPEVTNYDIRKKFSWRNPDFRNSGKSSADVQSKINLADRARKMDVRGEGGYESSLNYRDIYPRDKGAGSWSEDDPRWNWLDDPEHLDYIDPKTGGIAGLKSTKNKSRYSNATDYYDTIAGKERAKLNHEMTKNVQNMKQSLWDRKHYQKELDKNDAKYDSYKADIQKEYDDATTRYNQKLASNEERRQRSAKDAKANLDDTNAEINKLLKRKDESMLPEDFEEKNLDKRGTMEYEANKKRANRINMYRKFANLTEGEEITEENINERALNRTACFSNREPEQVRAEILGQRYSDYEI